MDQPEVAALLSFLQRGAGEPGPYSDKRMSGRLPQVGAHQEGSAWRKGGPAALYKQDDNKPVFSCQFSVLGWSPA
jgi:hypothetical protein